MRDAFNLTSEEASQSSQPRQLSFNGLLTFGKTSFDLPTTRLPLVTSTRSLQLDGSDASAPTSELVSLPFFITTALLICLILYNISGVGRSLIVFNCSSDVLRFHNNVDTWRILWLA